MGSSNMTPAMKLQLVCTIVMMLISSCQCQGNFQDVSMVPGGVGRNTNSLSGNVDFSGPGTGSNANSASSDVTNNLQFTRGDQRDIFFEPGSPVFGPNSRSTELIPGDRTRVQTRDSPRLDFPRPELPGSGNGNNQQLDSPSFQRTEIPQGGNSGNFGIDLSRTRLEDRGIGRDQSMGVPETNFLATNQPTDRSLGGQSFDGPGQNFAGTNGPGGIQDGQIINQLNNLGTDFGRTDLSTAGSLNVPPFDGGTGGNFQLLDLRRDRPGQGQTFGAPGQDVQLQDLTPTGLMRDQSTDRNVPANMNQGVGIDRSVPNFQRQDPVGGNLPVDRPEPNFASGTPQDQSFNRFRSANIPVGGGQSFDGPGQNFAGTNGPGGIQDGQIFNQLNNLGTDFGRTDLSTAGSLNVPPFDGGTGGNFQLLDLRRDRPGQGQTFGAPGQDVQLQDLTPTGLMRDQSTDRNVPANMNQGVGIDRSVPNFQRQDPVGGNLPVDRPEPNFASGTPQDQSFNRFISANIPVGGGQSSDGSGQNFAGTNGPGGIQDGQIFNQLNNLGTDFGRTDLSTAGSLNVPPFDQGTRGNFQLLDLPRDRSGQGQTFGTTGQDVQLQDLTPTGLMRDQPTDRNVPANMNQGGRRDRTVSNFQRQDPVGGNLPVDRPEPDFASGTPQDQSLDRFGSANIPVGGGQSFDGSGQNFAGTNGPGGIQDGQIFNQLNNLGTDFGRTDLSTAGSSDVLPFDGGPGGNIQLLELPRDRSGQGEMFGASGQDVQMQPTDRNVPANMNQGIGIDRSVPNFQRQDPVGGNLPVDRPEPNFASGTPQDQSFNRFISANIPVGGGQSSDGSGQNFAGTNDPGGIQDGQIFNQLNNLGIDFSRTDLTTAGSLNVPPFDGGTGGNFQLLDLPRDRSEQGQTFGTTGQDVQSQDLTPTGLMRDQPTDRNVPANMNQGGRRDRTVSNFQRQDPVGGNLPVDRPEPDFASGTPQDQSFDRFGSANIPVGGGQSFDGSGQNFAGTNGPGGIQGGQIFNQLNNLGTDFGRTDLSTAGSSDVPPFDGGPGGNIQLLDLPRDRPRQGQTFGASGQDVQMQPTDRNVPANMNQGVGIDRSVPNFQRQDPVGGNLPVDRPEPNVASGTPQDQSFDSFGRANIPVGGGQAFDRSGLEFQRQELRPRGISRDQSLDRPINDLQRAVLSSSQSEPALPSFNRPGSRLQRTEEPSRRPDFTRTDMSLRDNNRRRPSVDVSVRNLPRDRHLRGPSTGRRLDFSRFNPGTSLVREPLRDRAPGGLRNDLPGDLRPQFDISRYRPSRLPTHPGIVLDVNTRLPRLRGSSFREEFHFSNITDGRRTLEVRRDEAAVLPYLGPDIMGHLGGLVAPVNRFGFLDGRMPIVDRARMGMLRIGRLGPPGIGLLGRGMYPPESELGYFGSRYGYMDGRFDPMRHAYMGMGPHGPGFGGFIGHDPALFGRGIGFPDREMGIINY